MDQTLDTGFTQLHEIVQLYGEMPDYVKQASQKETLAPEGLTWASYADNVSKRFPCHTKAACFVSALYFEENKNQLPNWRQEQVSNRIKAAATEHGILADIEQIVHRSHQLAKEAATIDEADFMVPEERRYPLRNSGEVKAAAQYLLDYRDHFEFDDRMEMARRVLRKAAETETDLSDDASIQLQKQAGSGCCNPGEVLQQLKCRSVLHDNKDSKEAWNKLAAHIEQMDPVVLASLGRQVAKSIDGIDRNAGIKYGSLIKRPEDFMFEILYKKASEVIADSFATATGSVWSKHQLSALGHEDLAELWGEKMADSMLWGVQWNTERLAEKAASLDWRDATAFDWKMRELGCQPTSEMPMGMDISAGERSKLAQEYASR